MCSPQWPAASGIRSGDAQIADQIREAISELATEHSEA